MVGQETVKTFSSAEKAFCPRTAVWTCAILFEYEAGPLSFCSTAVDREGHFYGAGSQEGGVQRKGLLFLRGQTAQHARSLSFPPHLHPCPTKAWEHHVERRIKQTKKIKMPEGKQTREMCPSAEEA